MTVATVDTTTIEQDTPVSFLWLEITGKCQLACEHCYADTKRRGSYRRTAEGIAEALHRDIPLRVGLIGMRDGQHVEEACSQLPKLGVTDVKVDHLRQIGRGVRDRSAAMDELCGNCANGVLAVSPDGDVWPCVFARWMAVGNVRGGSGLRGIATGAVLSAARAELRAEFGSLHQSTSSVACNPHHDCPPCIPKNCNPRLFMKRWSVAPVAPMRYELGVEK